MFAFLLVFGVPHPGHTISECRQIGTDCDYYVKSEFKSMSECQKLEHEQSGGIYFCVGKSFD